MLHKKTRQKAAIIRALRGTKSHPTADWVYNEVRKEIPNISLGTVYRNLRLLKEDGEIRELELAGSLSRFDGEMTPHYHFRCEKCGKIIDVEEGVDEAINRRVSEKTGLTVSYHILEFRGLCHDCMKLTKS